MLADYQEANPNVSGIPIKNIWHMLIYAWEELFLDRLNGFEEIENAPSLDALFAMILAKLLQQRLRIGLGRNYIDETLLLRGIRGRINFNECLKKQTFRQGQAICNAQQFSLNVTKNQIIRSTLIRLIQIGQFGKDNQQTYDLRHRLRWLARMMDGVALIEIKPDIFRRQQLGRNDRDYKLMLTICELIWQHQMPTTTEGKDYLPSIDRDVLILHSIYERFVANFYRNHLRGWKVAPQHQMSWFESTANPYLPIMKPDLFLENKDTGQVVILDTKFTSSSLTTTIWGNSIFNSPNLYQIYTYIKTQEHLSEAFRESTGILLYPTVNRGQVSEFIKLQDHRIRIETIDLSNQWQEIEQNLLDIIQNN